MIIVGGTSGRQWTNDEFVNYMENALQGNARLFWECYKTTPEYQVYRNAIIQTRNPEEIATVLTRQFCGEVGQTGPKLVEQAKRNLINLSICDMSYFEEYSCEFEKYLY